MYLGGLPPKYTAEQTPKLLKVLFAYLPPWYNLDTIEDSSYSILFIFTTATSAICTERFDLQALLQNLRRNPHPGVVFTLARHNTKPAQKRNTSDDDDEKPSFTSVVPKTPYLLAVFYINCLNVSERNVPPLDGTHSSRSCWPVIHNGQFSSSSL